MTLLSCRIAAGDDLVVSGSHYIRFLIKSEKILLSTLQLSGYSNNGYKQIIDKSGDKTISAEVLTDCSEFHSEIRFPVNYNIPKWLKAYTLPSDTLQSDAPEIIKTAKSVVKNSKYQSEAVQKILRWINDNINYNLDPYGPKTALDVFKKRRGYCIGYSNLSVAMLRSVGIPSRNVHGIHFNKEEAPAAGDYNQLSLKGVTLHRWIEVYYPDVGWVFSDPMFSVNFINANYIFLSHQNSEGDYPAKNLEDIKVKVDNEKNNLVFIDLLHNKGGLLVNRPSIFQRINSMVTVTIKDKVNRDRVEIVIASLEKVQRSNPDGEGISRFIGLERGEYELKIRYNGELKYITKFSLKESEELNFDIKLDVEEMLNE